MASLAVSAGSGAFLAFSFRLLRLFGEQALLFCGLLLGSGFLGCAFATPELRLPPANEKPVPPANAEGRNPWQTLEPGLEFGEFKLAGSDSRLTALRIDPAKFDFTLCSASEDGGAPRSLSQWAGEKDLSAAINASMFLPDNRTSTGYMRSGGHINNGRIMERFGAFFVAGPKKAGLPRARIIDKDEPDWRAAIADYDTVIQNYRMTNSQRRILWSPGGPHYSISAVAQDGEGRILFLHSRLPVEAYSFVQEILHLPLDARTIMYVEGGAQAGLLVQSGGLRRELTGPHAPSLLVTGNLKAALPNVLGIRPRPEFQGVANPVN